MNNFEALNKEMLKTLVGYELVLQRKESELKETEKQLVAANKEIQNLKFLMAKKAKLEAKAKAAKLYIFPELTGGK